MRRTTTILLVIGMVAALAGAADARGRGMGRGPGCGMGPCMGMAPLSADSSGMSAELREKLQKEHAVLMEATLDLRADLFKKSERLQMLLGDPKAKDDDIMKLHQEIHALRGQLASKHLQHMLKVRKDMPEGFLPRMMGPCGGMCGMCGMPAGFMGDGMRGFRHGGGGCCGRMPMTQ